MLIISDKNSASIEACAVIAAVRGADRCKCGERQFALPMDDMLALYCGSKHVASVSMLARGRFIDRPAVGAHDIKYERLFTSIPVRDFQNARTTFNASLSVAYYAPEFDLPRACKALYSLVLQLLAAANPNFYRDIELSSACAEQVCQADISLAQEDNG